MLHKTLLSAILIGTTLSAVLASPAQEVEQLWATTGPPEALFGIIAGVTEAPDGSIIVSDSGSPTLYRYSPERGFLGIFASRGQGPGELGVPTLSTTTPAGLIGLYDIGRRSVFLYDERLEPVRDIRISALITNPKGFVFLPDDTFLLAGGRMGGSTGDGPTFHVHHFDENGELLASYLVQPPTDDASAAVHTAGGPLIVLDSGGFLFSNSAPHRIVRFDETMVSEVVAEDPQILDPILDRFTTVTIRPEDGRRVHRYDWFYEKSKAIFELPDGRILNIITRRKQGDSVWEVWSAKGELLSRFVEPRPYREFALAAQGTVIVAVFEDPATAEDTVVGLRLRF